MAANTIAIIPARGGSKRIPLKNIKPLHGKPLIAYTIEAALACGVFQRVIVSTDDPTIADVGTAAGAEVPYFRPAELADDFTPVSAATADALKHVDPAGDRFEHVCQLMANCPLRDATDIADSYKQFRQSRARSQISVVRFGWQNPWWSMRRLADYVLEPMFPDALKTRSQNLPELFCPTGAIWWARTDVLRSENTFHAAGRTGWEIAWQHGIDIDTDDDWVMAELMLTLAGNKGRSPAK